MGVYIAFMKVTRFYGRLITSAAAGFMAAMFFCLGGGKLLGAKTARLASSHTLETFFGVKNYVRR